MQSINDEFLVDCYYIALSLHLDKEFTDLLLMEIHARNLNLEDYHNFLDNEVMA